MKIFIETMGCQMNQLDSELVTASLQAAGHEVVGDRRGAQVVLYNTCSVRQHAEQKVLSRLGADRKHKADGKKLIVGVLGCMAQRLGESLIGRYPAVDLVCGPGQLYRLADMIADAAAGRAAVALDPAIGQGPDEQAEQGMDRLDLSRNAELGPSVAQAYVRVMRGCDVFCSYCIVPYVRGRQRSRNPDHIAEEVRRLVETGKTEITLLGQIVNCYKWPDGRTSVRFADLLSRISDTPGLRRLRFVTSHPLQFTDDILQAMRDLPNICQYIHCPAQSGSDAVLERMNRRYSRSQYDQLIDRARLIVPQVVLAGDFIVGFPGETEADHEASAELIRRAGYKNSFIFKYSPRPGAVAARRLEDDVPDQVKRRRNNELLAVQAEVSLAHHRAYLGRTCEVLVTGPSPRVDKQAAKPSSESMQLVGRSRGDHVVVFDGPEQLIGQYVDVRIIDASALTLFGELADRRNG